MNSGTTLILDSNQLNVTWPAYVELLREQEQLWWRHNKNIAVFGENSYLAESSQSTAAFDEFGALQSMDDNLRAFVGGWLRGYRYFGNMASAGRYMGIVKRTPEFVDTFLNQIPRKGPVREDQIQTYFAGVTAMHGISLPGTATRLLVSKRPDVFLGLTSANRDGVIRVFGRSPRKPDEYLVLLRRIWSFPWYKAPRPTDAEGQEVWDARVALLDAFLFDASGNGAAW